MSTNRRVQERFSLNLQAKISYRHLTDDSPVYETVAANISAGGAFLETREEFAMASKVKIEFYLNLDDVKKLKFILSMDSLKKVQHNHVWVAATGIVIRQEENGVGIIFDTDYQITPMQSSDSKS